MAPQKDWEQLGFHVTKELERHDEWLASLQRKYEDVRIELATVKAKASLLGFVAGGIPAAVAAAYFLLRN